MRKPNPIMSRRKRLKDATLVRRDEFDLEEKCISSVEALTSDLRSSIDQVRSPTLHGGGHTPDKRGLPNVGLGERAPEGAQDVRGCQRPHGSAGEKRAHYLEQALGQGRATLIHNA